MKKSMNLSLPCWKRHTGELLPFICATERTELCQDYQGQAKF